MSDDVMDYRGLSAYLKMPQGSLRHKVMRGEIPCIKIGRNVRFAKKDIDVWLIEHQRIQQKMSGGNAGESGNDLFAACGEGVLL